SVYEEALVCELQLRGLEVGRQKSVPIVHKGARLASDLRLDARYYPPIVAGYTSDLGVSPFLFAPLRLRAFALISSLR
ncbi:MAG: GxxExxY protein, partial [Thermoanaerobaculales bacterium]